MMAGLGEALADGRAKDAQSESGDDTEKESAHQNQLHANEG